MTGSAATHSDVIIVGSGAAGLTAALNLADSHKVLVIAKGGLSEGSTAYAQGGIAAVLEPGDTFASHIEDTMIAGAGLNDRAVVEFVVENAPGAIRRLIDLGVPFNTEGPGGQPGAASDARGRPQPSPHRPCRRCHRLPPSSSALESRRPRRIRTSPSVPDMRGDRSRYRPAWRALFGRRSCVGASMRSTGQRATWKLFTARATDPRHWRRWPRLSLFHRPARRHRRRDRDGMAGGLRASPTWRFMQFHPDLPVRTSTSRIS